MPWRVHQSQASILAPPAASDSFRQAQTLSVGDLHGNALALVHFLGRHGLIELSESDYLAMAAAYRLFEPKDALNQWNDHLLNDDCETLAQAIAEFDRILERLRVRRGPLVRFLGDLLADRGANDYWVLRVLAHLAAGGLDFEILLSNHDLTFLHDFYCAREPQLFHARLMIPQNCGSGQAILEALENAESSNSPWHLYRSNVMLKYCLHHGLVRESQVRAWVENVYLPRLCLVGVSTLRDTVLRFYTHAPVGLSVLVGLALFWGVIDINGVPGLYADPACLRWAMVCTNLRFLSAIQDPTTRFNLLLRLDIAVRCRCSQSGVLPAALVERMGPWMQAMLDLVWFRTRAVQLRAIEPLPCFSVQMVHGHDFNDRLPEPDAESPVVRYFNLNTAFGAQWWGSAALQPVVDVESELESEPEPEPGRRSVPQAKMVLWR